MLLPLAVDSRALVPFHSLIMRLALARTVGKPRKSPLHPRSQYHVESSGRHGGCFPRMCHVGKSSNSFYSEPN